MVNTMEIRTEKLMKSCDELINFSCISSGDENTFEYLKTTSVEDVAQMVRMIHLYDDFKEMMIAYSRQCDTMAEQLDELLKMVKQMNEKEEH